ncbi:MAG: hypothetical protein K2X27_12590, partial [Candidatus Obscuribacterales bacterium]|nr:hypothetical protein [Candidatus Obscuribacterales bacterium]
QLPVPSNAWLPTQTTLASPVIYSGVTNTAASPGGTVLTLTSTTGISTGQTLVLDPQGPGYEQVTVSSVNAGANQITITTGLAKYHSATETVYVRPNQTGLSTIVNAGAGAPPTTPLINNGQIFAPNLNSLSNGAVTIGTITGTGAVTVATNGAVQVNTGISLTVNPTTATPLPTNFYRLPLINISGSSVSVASGATINSNISACNYCPSTTNIFTQSLSNGGTIGAASGSNMMVNVQSNANLAVTGAGNFLVPAGSVIELAAADKNILNLNSALSFATGSTSAVLLNAQGNGGTININGAMSFSGGPVVSVNTPGLNPGANSSFNSTGGGAFLFSSGYTANPLTLTMAGGTFALSGAPSAFTAYSGQNISLTGTGTISSTNPVIFQTSNGGTYSNNTLTFQGTTFYSSSNPSGNIQGFEFQPYIGGRITSNTKTFVQFAAYPYQEVIALIANGLATVDSSTGVVSPQFQYVSGYTQVSSNGYVIQAAKNLGLRASAGVFADINGDGSMTQSAFNTAIYDTQAAVTGASLYGNVLDIVVGNEDIVGNGGADASASMATLKNLIQGGTIQIQFVGPGIATGAQPLRNAAINPLTGTNFSSTTLPVVTRQQNGVLNLVTDPNVNNKNGMIALMNALDGYVYGNFYPFFDTNGVVSSLISNPSISKSDFTTLVQNYMSTQFDTNTTNFGTAGLTTKIRVGETGWATPMTALSTNPLIGYAGVGLPQQNLTWAQWYYPAMQSWSSTHQNAQTGTPGVIIGTYFAMYDEPWKGVTGKAPNGTAVTVGTGANAGLTTLPVSNGNIFYSPTLTPMSVLINPPDSNTYAIPSNMEIQNYYNPNPGGNNLPLSTTGFPGSLVYTHSVGETVLAASPQEPFFGLFTATGSNLSTGTIYQLSSTTQKYSISPLTSQVLFQAPAPGPTPFTSSAAPASSNLPNLAAGPLTTAGLNNFLSLASGLPNTTIVPTDINPEIVPGSQADTGDLGSQSAYPGNPNLTGTFAQFNNNILPNPQGNFVTLENGNAFFLPDHNIVVETPQAKINISEGAAVMIFQNGSNLSVFNLYDNKAGAVAINVGDETQELGVGRQISISDKQGQQARHILPDSLAVRNMARGKLNSKDAISSEFSHISAISQLVGLKKLFRSDDPEDRRKAERILKTAAALSLINKNAEAFKTTKE